MCLEKRLELCFGNCADLLRGYGAVAEQEQGWNTANIELGRGFGILVNVELDDAELVFVLGGYRVENRRDHLAGAAPFGPKVEKHGLSRLHYILFESRVCRMYDLTTHNAESSRFLGRPETPLGRIGEKSITPKRAWPKSDAAWRVRHNLRQVLPLGARRNTVGI